MLQPWLAQAVSQWRAGPSEVWPTAAIVSIGNDAGDLDSLVSSLALADWQPVGSCSDRPLWLPVAPFARQDFRLRQDACLLFSHIGWDFDDLGAPAHLMHLDEAEQAAADHWRNAGGLGLALVDHNSVVKGVRSIFGERVVTVIDHHNDEQRHLAPVTGSDALGAMLAVTLPIRTIEPAVGSTCSILVELMDRVGGSEAGGGLRMRSTELCVLLLSAVAVDTRGLDPALLGEKYCAADVRAAQKLYLALGAAVPRVLPPVGRAGAEAYELVLEALLALRKVELPSAAQVMLATVTTHCLPLPL